MKIKTLGEFRELTKNLSDDFNIEMRIHHKLSDEELVGLSYPFPISTRIVDLEYDDIGWSDKDLCLSVINN